MQFRTEIPIPKSDHPIDYNSRVMSLGSCFAVNIADKLDYFQFVQNVNPFGILFHPQAIEKFIGFAQDDKHFCEADIFFHNERWHCYDAHSDLSDPNPVQLLQKLNLAVSKSRARIQKATHLIITYGTAWAYREKASQQLVANCHKMPQIHFSKEILPVDAIEHSIRQTIAAIRNLNPNAKILFTVSPVRHLKDGFSENQRSKSHLLSGLHQAIQDNACSYFPSYEIMMDDLRDYRFYAEDMIHPNQIAVDYIWQRFSQTHISESAFPVMEQVNHIRKGLAHRAFDPDSQSHKQFIAKLQSQIDALQQQYPHMQF